MTPRPTPGICLFQDITKALSRVLLPAFACDTFLAIILEAWGTTKILVHQVHIVSARETAPCCIQRR